MRCGGGRVRCGGEHVCEVWRWACEVEMGV